VAFVENVTKMQPGEGLWKTVVKGPSTFAIHVPDEVNHTVGYLAMMTYMAPPPAPQGASPEERARRRATDPSHASGKGTAVHEVASALAERDYSDSTRKASPLAMAADAVLIDTTGLAIDDVVERVLGELDVPVLEIAAIEQLDPVRARSAVDAGAWRERAHATRFVVGSGSRAGDRRGGAQCGRKPRETV
jgi:hypothetical protein